MLTREKNYLAGLVVAGALAFPLINVDNETGKLQFITSGHEFMGCARQRLGVVPFANMPADRADSAGAAQ